VKAAKEYAGKLKEVKARLADDLLVVMRVYFEKPRTTVGWKGLINDPKLDGSFSINEGIRIARELLLEAQALDPDAPEVARALAESEQTLQALYESKLGKLSVVPRVRLRDDEVIWLNLDHRAGFILAQIDGALTFDDLFSVSGMSRLDTARILVQLLEQRVIIR